MAGASTSRQPGAPDRSASPGKAYTPPKGRPTRSQRHRARRQRVFGPVAQWSAVAVLLLLVLAVLIVVTDGGDFNPFDDGGSGPAPAGASFPSS